MPLLPEDPSPRAAGAGTVSFGEAFRVWCRVATLSFGGPAAQIAVMHRILVEEKRWVSSRRLRSGAGRGGQRRK